MSTILTLDKLGQGLLTSFGRECSFVVQQILNPGHYVVDIRWGGQIDTFTVLVDPSVVQPVQ